jgi:hypothetical protein
MAIRPRGDDISIPVVRYVGQLARHRPQCTQSWIGGHPGQSCGRDGTGASPFSDAVTAVSVVILSIVNNPG